MANRHRLEVAALRANRSLLGDASVHVLELGHSILSPWRVIETAYKRHRGRDEVQAPKSIITTTLRARTGGYVWFAPNKGRGYLVSRAAIDPDTLRDVFTLFHGIVNGYSADQVDLNSPPLVAEQIAARPMEQRLIADFLVRGPGGQPDAEGWVYDAATWDLAHRIAAVPWEVDGHTIQFRPDNTGGLIAWDDPYSNKAGTAFAVNRVRLRMKTLPNYKDPFILTSSQVTRLSAGLGYARTVLAEQADPRLPILEVEMDGRGRVRTVNRLALDVLGRIGVDHSVLHGIQDQAHREEAEARAAQEAGEKWRPTAERKAKIRAVQGKTFRFPIGRGTGMHHARELDRHIREVLGEAARAPEVYRSWHAFPKFDLAKNLFMEPEYVVRGLDTMGHERMRLVCLWATDEMRLRMIKGLADLFRLDAASLDPVEGRPLDLVDGRIGAVFHQAPEFLAHGSGIDRSALLAGLSGLAPQEGTVIGVWAETEYGQTEEDGAEEPASESSAGVPDKGKEAKTGKAAAPEAEEDAKHQTRRLLAVQGTVTQYTAARKEAKRKPKTSKDGTVKPDVDHQVAMSLLDLTSRQIGVIDHRIDAAMVPIGSYASTGVAHCGVHVRVQNARKKGEAAKISVTASALVPPSVEGLAWTLHGWSYTCPRWQQYNKAAPAFHGIDYPAGKMTELVDDEAGYKKVAKEVDRALADLVEYLGHLPYTVTVDGVATRRLWAGLHNRRQGTEPDAGTWLPGSTLPAKERPLAVIRLNKDPQEVPQPLGVTTLLEDGSVKTGATTTVLFESVPDFGDPAWFLANTPHQFDGAGSGRLGEKKTRWSALHGKAKTKTEPGERNEVADNWYAMNATEIFPVAVAEGIDRAALARLTGMLCQRSLSWGNRTRYPVPLHAAQQMDLDHPQYRRTAAAADPEAETVGDGSDADGADS